MSNIGYVYKIYDNTNWNVYYGSTKCKLSQRLAEHRNSYVSFLNGKRKFYPTSFNIIKNGDYNISLVEEVKNDTKPKLYAREGFYIESNTCINKNIPTRDSKEYNRYYKNNKKDEIKEYKTNYYKENTDKLKKISQEYRDND